MSLNLFYWVRVVKKSSILCFVSACVLLLTVFNNVSVYGENPITFVSVTGEISSYGTNSAFGWVNFFAVVENRADGFCVFTVPPLGPTITIYPPPPFDFTVYLTKIFNASEVKLNYNPFDFWISGFWEINNVTNPSDIRDIAMLLKDMTIAAGELSVKGNWTEFTIDIEGYESIEGYVTAYSILEIDQIYGKLPYADLNRDHKIDIRDIATFALAFGSSLGFERYNFYADINFDLVIDIRDIATCAKLFREVY